MSLLNLEESKAEILSKIQQNLNLTDIKDGSYIKTLADGLYNFNEIIREEVNNDINELYLETADIDKVERFGISKGIPRIKNNGNSFNHKSQKVFLLVDLYRENKDLELLLFSKGDEIYFDIFILTLYEDVVYTSLLDKLFITGNIRLNDSFNLSFNTLVKDKEFQLQIKESQKNLIKHLTLVINDTISFTSVQEDETSYRTRLKTALLTENISEETYIKSVLTSVPYVYNYYINKDVYPHEINLVSEFMYNTESYDSVMESFAIFISENMLKNIKSFSSNFEIKKAERVKFFINIKTTNEFTIYLDDIRSFIKSFHYLGSKMFIDKTFIEGFLQSKGYDINFEVEFYLEYKGIRVLNNTPDILVIHENQFPHLTSVEVNSEIPLINNLYESDSYEFLNEGVVDENTETVPGFIESPPVEIATK